MKKFILISFLFAFTSCAIAQNTTPRFGTASNMDRTLSHMTADYQTKTFTTTPSILCKSYETYVKMGTLTAAQTDTAVTSLCYAGDKLTMLFTCDTLTAGRVVTFGAGFAVSGTLTVAKNKKAAISFVFDGVAWIATGREKQ